MSRDPLVSVIIPVYNGTNYLAEAVASVQAQTYRNFELIIVDDGSTDGTWDLIQSFGRRIRGYQKPNGGVATALNLGIAKANGALVAWLSHDDLFLPNKLQRQVAFLRDSPAAEACYTDYLIIDPEGKPLREIQTPALPRHELLRRLFHHSLIDGSTTLIARGCFERVGPFNETLRYTQDLDMWIRIAAVFEFARLPAVLGKQRWHPDRGSTNVTTHLTEQRALYSKWFAKLGVEGLFPERGGDPDSAKEIAFAHTWFADAMAHGHHFFDLADHHNRESARAWPSPLNPARTKAVTGSRLWTAPSRWYRRTRHRLGTARKSISG